MIIGISGKKQVGKNTVGEIIKKQHPNFKLVSFAQALKFIASYITGYDIECWEDAKFKDSYNVKFDKTNREILQIIGEGFRKNLYSDIWVDILFSHYLNGEDWIVTDVREVNEANKIKKLGGVLIRINRNTGYVDNHVSETNLDNYDKFDYIVNNNGSLEELKDKINLIFK